MNHDNIDQIQARATRLISFCVVIGTLCMMIAVTASAQNRSGFSDGYLLGWKSATAHLPSAENAPREQP